MKRSLSILAVALAACSSEAPKTAPKEDAEVPAVAAALSASKSAAAPAQVKRRPKSILIAEAHEVVTWRVADGFLDRAAIVARAMAAADERETLRDEIERLVDEELTAHKKRERDWRYLTDPDRLTRAFETLSKAGIIARERFTDCRKCGVSEMLSLREEVLERGERADGYVFYTEQDADGVSRSGELVLEFGSFAEDDVRDARVAATVTNALKAARFDVVDESDEESAYLVLNELEWNRRRFTKAPAK